MVLLDIRLHIIQYNTKPLIFIISTDVSVAYGKSYEQNIVNCWYFFFNMYWRKNRMQQLPSFQGYINYK